VSTADGALLAGLRDGAGELPSGGPEWLASLRRDASESLRRGGLPGKRDEAWRFTPVGDVVATPFARPSEALGAEALRARVGARLGEDGTFQVMVVDGRPRLDLAGAPPEGIRIQSLDEAIQDDPEALEDVLGRLAPAEHFAGLNAALFEDGVLVTVTRGARPTTPLQLVHLRSEGAVALPRVLVRVGEGAELQLVETFLGGEGPGLTNQVVECDLGAAARLDHVRVHEDPGHLVAWVAVRQARSSVYASHVVSLAGALMRLDLHVALEGEGAECVLDGAYHALGQDHLDHHSVVTHRAPHTRSDQTYHGVLDARGRAVFDGIVKVLPTAPHSECHQVNRNLLLSDGAIVHSKPHLEIDTDEVVASHGTTVGSLDDDQLFYLKSRAVPEDTARSMLIYAFVRAVIDRLPEAGIRARLGRALLDRLPDGETLREDEALRGMA